MEGSIRVLIADGQRLRREGLGLILGDENGIEVVGEAVNGIQTINLVDDLKPDVVLLDISLPELDGSQAILPIRQKSPRTKALVFAHDTDEGVIFKLLKAGAKGYISEESAASDVPKAIKAVHRGELWVARSMVSRFVDQEAIADSNGQNARKNNQESLTSREQEVQQGARTRRSPRTFLSVKKQLNVTLTTSSRNSMSPGASRPCSMPSAKALADRFSVKIQPVSG